MMKLPRIITLASLALTLGLSQSGFSAESATAEEVVKKVQAAAEELSKKGEAAIAEFKGKDSKWAWKDTYVFVFNCTADKMLAHPTLEGKTVMDLKDKKGSAFFKGLCEESKKPHGGWVAYMWPKPGAEGDAQKITYAMHAKGTELCVAAGIYDDKAKVEDLNKLLK